MAEYRLTNVNRWGELVFETSDPLEMWDGTNKSREVSERVYFYIINYRLQREEEPIQLQVNVTVTR